LLLIAADCCWLLLSAPDCCWLLLNAIIKTHITDDCIEEYWEVLSGTERRSQSTKRAAGNWRPSPLCWHWLTRRQGLGSHNSHLGIHQWAKWNFCCKIEMELITAFFSLRLSTSEKNKSKQDFGLASMIWGIKTTPQDYAGSWSGTKWELLTHKYPQHICWMLGCQKCTSMHCECMVGNWMCPSCSGIHIASVVEGS
jgi:hypothetical protein